ncbi:MAG: hypothetical protein WA970_06885 [Gammaproteobacteria bacterium]
MASAILILTLLMEPLTRKCALQAKKWEYSPKNGADLDDLGGTCSLSQGKMRIAEHHLSSLVATLILLAYLAHTALEWVDDQYRLLRQKLPSRKRLFHDIRTLTCYLCFDAWAHLLDFILQGFHRPIRAPE